MFYFFDSRFIFCVYFSTTSTTFSVIGMRAGAQEGGRLQKYNIVSCGPLALLAPKPSLVFAAFGVRVDAPRRLDAPL
jgi:hypothetical protein